MKITDLKIKLFADGADLAGMLKLAELSYIKGFTTNPTLMRKAGVKDYAEFAYHVLEHLYAYSVSFEVFSDDFVEMERQARIISKWGSNVYVKIPITNTKHESACPLVHRLSHDGIKVNVTAMMTLDQVRDVSESLRGGADSIVSVFAGRIADTGRDPIPLMAAALNILLDCPTAELLWASPRELLNIIQADLIGCHIITATGDVLGKLKNLEKDLDEYSLETVKMFFDDAQAAGFTL